MSETYMYCLLLREAWQVDDIDDVDEMEVIGGRAYLMARLPRSIPLLLGRHVR
jgi:hypothetical protein